MRGRNRREEHVQWNNFHRKLVKRERSEVISEITVIHEAKVQGKGTSWNRVRMHIYWWQKWNKQKKTLGRTQQIWGWKNFLVSLKKLSKVSKRHTLGAAAPVTSPKPEQKRKGILKLEMEDKQKERELWQAMSLWEQWTWLHLTVCQCPPR